MIIKPKIRGFICTTAHPEGCAAHVTRWINYIKKNGSIGQGPRKVLVIGASTGFGLASRVVAAFAAGAKTIGVFFEKPASGKRTASPGWYNSAAFEQAAHDNKIYAKSINGDAFSTDIKNKTIELIKKDWGGEVDLVIYSIASPRRVHPTSGECYTSVLKPVGQSYSNKTVDMISGDVSDITINAATEEEIRHTEAVMGGEDWQLWIEQLLQNGCLARGAKTIAFTYIGPELTHPIYRDGTIGKAKLHLQKTADILKQRLREEIHGDAHISVNKALVTQASAAIPIVPLYISLLYKIMKEKNIHEGCIEQMWRLFAERLYSGVDTPFDNQRRIRIDDWEMRVDVQDEVKKLWTQVTGGNIEAISDIKGYRDEFYHLFGFGFEEVNYQHDVELSVAVPSIKES